MPGRKSTAKLASAIPHPKLCYFSIHYNKKECSKRSVSKYMRADIFFKDGEEDSKIAKTCQNSEVGQVGIMFVPLVH